MLRTTFVLGVCFAAIGFSIPAAAQLRVDCITSSQCRNGSHVEDRFFGSFRLRYNGHFDENGHREGTGTLEVAIPGDYGEHSFRLNPLVVNFQGIFRNDYFQSGTTWSDSSNRTRAGCLRGNCQNGVGVYYGPVLFGEAVRYEGPFREFRPHGSGSITFSDGSAVKRTFHAGYPLSLPWSLPVKPVMASLLLIAALGSLSYVASRRIWR